MSTRSDGPLSSELGRLRADARYAQERYQLYKARTYGPRLNTPARLAELEEVCLRAERRLRRAEAAEQNDEEGTEHG
jgi:hypothetical protein